MIMITITITTNVIILNLESEGWQILFNCWNREDQQPQGVERFGKMKTRQSSEKIYLMIRRMKVKKDDKENEKRKIDVDDQTLTQGIGQIWVKWVRSSSASPTLSATWNTFACKRISIIIIKRSA